MTKASIDFIYVYSCKQWRFVHRQEWPISEAIAVIRHTKDNLMCESSMQRIEKRLLHRLGEQKMVNSILHSIMASNHFCWSLPIPGHVFLIVNHIPVFSDVVWLQAQWTTDNFKKEKRKESKNSAVFLNSFTHLTKNTIEVTTKRWAMWVSPFVVCRITMCDVCNIAQQLR